MRFLGSIGTLSHYDSNPQTLPKARAQIRWLQIVPGLSLSLRPLHREIL